MSSPEWENILERAQEWRAAGKGVAIYRPDDIPVNQPRRRLLS